MIHEFARRSVPPCAAAAVLYLFATMTAAAERPLLFPHGSLRVHQRGAATVLSITDGRRATRLTLPTDDGIFPDSYPGFGSGNGTVIVGAIPDRVLILSMDYASRPDGGSLPCGAGVETMLRIVVLRPTPRQTFHELVQSCWSNVDPGDVDWNDATRRLTVERTAFDPPDPEPHRRRTHYQVAADGSATVLAVENLP